MRSSGMGRLVHEPGPLSSSTSSDSINTDVLVVGCGIAGCSTALAAAQNGCHVTMLSLSEDIKDCNSFWYFTRILPLNPVPIPDRPWFRRAQGGIVYRGKEDSVNLLAKDILVAGANENKKSAVMYLSEYGPKVCPLPPLEAIATRLSMRFSSQNLSTSNSTATNTSSSIWPERALTARDVSSTTRTRPVRPSFVYISTIWRDPFP